MNAEQLRDLPPIRHAVLREDRIDPMWSADEDERRTAFIRRAAAGARKALRASA